MHWNPLLLEGCSQKLLTRQLEFLGLQRGPDLTRSYVPCVINLAAETTSEIIRRLASEPAVDSDAREVVPRKLSLVPVQRESHPSEQQHITFLVKL